MYYKDFDEKSIFIIYEPTHRNFNTHDYDQVEPRRYCTTFSRGFSTQIRVKCLCETTHFVECETPHLVEQ